MEAVKNKESFLKNTKTQAYLMITPTVLLILLFGLYPMLYVLFYSFTNYNGMSTPDFVGLANYSRVLQDSSWWLTVKNTFQIGIVTSLIQVPIALVLALMVSGKLKGTGFFRAILFLPSITSTAIMGIVFYFLFASYNGYVNEIFISMNMIDSPISWLGDGLLAKGVVVAFLSWHDIGFFMLLFLAALQKIPGDVYESAKIDGANVIQTFTKITVPMLGKMFQIISMLSIVNALKLFDSVKALTNGGPGADTEVMTMYIYRYFFENTGIPQQGYASAVSMVATIIVAGVAVIYLILTKKMNYED